MKSFARDTSALESDPAVRALLGAVGGEPVELSPDEPLGAPGQRLDRVYVVTEGLLKVSHLSGEDRAATSRMIGPGGLVGDVDILVDSPHLTETRAVVASRAHAIPAVEFSAMLREGRFAFDHLRHVCARFCVVARQQRAILHDVPARAAGVLLAYAEAFPRPTGGALRVGVPLTQAELASDLGVNLRSVNRAFTEWRKAGVLQVNKGWIEIRDLDALRKSCGSLGEHLLYPARFRDEDRGGRDFWRDLPQSVAPPESVTVSLRDNPAFRDATREELDALLADAHWLEAAPGQLLIESGQASSYVDVLLEGRIRVFHAMSSERKVTVKHLGAPCTLGEMQALTGLAYFQYAEALTTCRILRIRSYALMAFLEQNRNAALGLLNDVVARLYLAYRHEASILTNVSGRIASIMLAYADAFGRETPEGLIIRHPLTQKSIAGEIGATPKSINRTFSAWKEQGWVDQYKGWFRIRERAALEKACGGLRFNIKYEADSSGGVSPSQGWSGSPPGDSNSE